jgi:diphthine-ammonia ligase
LWRRSQRDVLEDIIGAGFNVIIVGVYAEGLTRDWLGRRLDASSLEDMARISKKHGINISGEGGEFETLVLDGPNFRKRMEILESRIVWRGASGEFIVKKARLTDK